MAPAILGVKNSRDKSKKVDHPNIDYARRALIKLKLLLGALLYMKSPKIEDIPKEQKERIVDVLDALDKEMEKHPRDTTKGLQRAWQRQGLKAYWDQYMDESFDLAKRRIEHDMNSFIGMLERKWRPKQGTTTSEKDVIIFYSQIKKLQAARIREKARPWTTPR